MRGRRTVGTGADRHRERLSSLPGYSPLICARLGIPPVESYKDILLWKGAVLERQRRERKLRRNLRAAGDPELLGLMDQRQSVVARLAALALADPDPRSGASEERARTRTPEQARRRPGTRTISEEYGLPFRTGPVQAHSWRACGKAASRLRPGRLFRVRPVSDGHTCTTRTYSAEAPSRGVCPTPGQGTRAYRPRASRRDRECDRRLAALFAAPRGLSGTRGRGTSQAAHVGAAGNAPRGDQFGAGLTLRQASDGSAGCPSRGGRGYVPCRAV